MRSHVLAHEKVGGTTTVGAFVDSGILMPMRALVVVLVAGCSYTAPANVGSGPDSVDAAIAGDAIASSRVRERLTVKTPPATELVDFPVLVVLDSTRIDYTQAAPDGADLRFVDDNNTLLSHEIERWDPTGTSAIWVKVPRIPANTPSGFWMYFGDPDSVDGQNPSGVWTAGYRAVWHLSENVADEGTTGSHVDSTGHANTGIQHGNAGVDATGGIAGVQDFDGVDDGIEVSPTDLSITGSELTIEVRALARSGVNTWPHVIGAGSDGRYWQIWWDPGGQGWGNRFQVDGAKVENWTTTGPLNVWTTLASVYDGSAARLFIDGQPVSSAPGSGTLDALSTPLGIGMDPNLVPRNFDGLIDEVRISEVARSEAWLHAQHLSETDALLEFGAPEMLP